MIASLKELADMIANHYGEILFALSIGSVLMVLGFVTLGARVVAHLPADYFINDERRAEGLYLKRLPPMIQIVFQVLKNLLGAVLVLVGVILLVLPGQGFLTILAGLLLMEFPGKYACERWIVQRPQVLSSINWIRRRAGEPPLRAYPDKPV